MTSQTSSYPVPAAPDSQSDILFLKHDSSIFRQSSNPVCGFSMMEQVRFCAVWPMENWFGSSMHHTDWICYCHALEKGCLLPIGRCTLLMPRRTGAGSSRSTVYVGYHEKLLNVTLSDNHCTTLWNILNEEGDDLKNDAKKVTLYKRQCSVAATALF